MDMVIEDDDSHHYSETEELSLLTLEPRAILYQLREGGREGEEREGVGDKIMSCII